MVVNYLRTTFRNLFYRKGYSLLNVAGLILGMTCCLLLFQYVAYEISYDRFNTKKDRIYRAVQQITQNGEDKGMGVHTGFIYGPTMAREVPGILRYTRVHPNYGDAVFSCKGASKERSFAEKNIFYVDSTFLHMFDYPLLKGTPEQVFARPQSILLSESMARKYFENEDPIGKALEVSAWVQGTYTVTGVFRDVPSTSHLHFDFLMGIEDLLKIGQYQGEGADWGWSNFITYFEITGNSDITSIETKITESFTHYQRDVLESRNSRAKAILQPLLDIHLNKDIRSSYTVTGDRKVVTFFTIIGLITLVIALVNYVNLATARAVDRAREVGVRKVVGAHRGQLIGQFLTESVVTNLLALGVAIGLSLVLLPYVNRLAEVSMTRALWLDVRFWAVFLGVFGTGALLAGLYPAFILSSFKPVTVLKGRGGTLSSRVLLRKILVVIQFTASIALLAGTLIVYSQLNYLRGVDTGLDLERVLVLEAPRIRPDGMDPVQAMSTLRDELRKIPGIGQAGLSTSTPGRGFNLYTLAHRSTADPSTAQSVCAAWIDQDFPEVYGMDLIAGEAFYEGMIQPDSGEQSVLINEAMVKAVGFSSNEAAINDRITLGQDNTLLVKGVFKDFSWSSAHQKTEAVAFFYGTFGRNLAMKVSTNDLPRLISRIQERYETLFPGNPFVYHFSDAAFDEQFKADRRFARLFSIFAGLAVLIACLGLFGLASFTAVQRTKEIGIRKALGASVPDIITLLSRDFLKLVFIAFVIAVPVAYTVMNRWLQDFAHHIQPGPRIFILAGTLSLLIALVTVSYQSIKAALLDPVRSLRYE